MYEKVLILPGDRIKKKKKKKKKEKIAVYQISPCQAEWNTDLWNSSVLPSRDSWQLGWLMYESAQVNKKQKGCYTWGTTMPFLSVISYQYRHINTLTA